MLAGMLLLSPAAFAAVTVISRTPAAAPLAAAVNVPALSAMLPLASATPDLAAATPALAARRPDGMSWFVRQMAGRTPAETERTSAAAFDGSVERRGNQAARIEESPVVEPTAGGQPTRRYSLQRRALKRFDHADSPVKVAFFDADSTLRVSLKGGVSASGPADVLLLPWVGRALARLVEKGYLVAIVSNQGGVPRMVSLEDADRALAYTIELIRRDGGDVHYFDFAENRGARKPATAMALRLEHELTRRYGPRATIDKANSLMVGDSAWAKGKSRPDGSPGTHFSDADRLFAENLGVRFEEPTDFFGWRRHGIDVFTTKAQVERFLARFPPTRTW